MSSEILPRPPGSESEIPLTDTSAPASGYINRAATGSAFLILRQVLVQFVNMAGGVVLARYLSVGEYGFLGVVAYALGVLASLGDLGLTMSLLQQKNEPTEREYSVAFTAQVALAVLAAAGFLCLMPWMQGHYRLDDSYQVFLAVAAGSFLISLFRSIPQTKLERDLRFTELAVLEIILALVYNGCAIGLAISGAGVWSFMTAIVLRSAVSVVALNVVSRARLCPTWDWGVLRRQLGTGFPMQLTSYIALLKDSMSPVIIGMTLGLAATGIANMAGLIANVPAYLCSVLSRVYLPTFSRARDSAVDLKRILDTAVFVVNSIVAPLSFFVLLFRESFTVILFGEKWLPTEVLFPYLWTANLVVPTVHICLGLLNAIGESRRNVTFSVLWAVLAIGAGAPLVSLFGLVGLGYAILLVNLATVAYLIMVKAAYGYNVLPGIVKGWLPSVVAAGVFWVGRSTIPLGYHRAADAIYVGGIVYLLLAAAFWFAVYSKTAVSSVRAALRGRRG